MVAEADSPPAVNWTSCPLLFMMVALREKVSSSSTMRSLIMVTSQDVDMEPGPLAAVNVTRHVVPIKSSPAPGPSIVEEMSCYTLKPHMSLTDAFTCSSVNCLSTSCNLCYNFLCCCPTGCIQHKTDWEWGDVFRLWVCWPWELQVCNCMEQNVSSL